MAAKNEEGRRNITPKKSFRFSAVFQFFDVWEGKQKEEEGRRKEKERKKRRRREKRREEKEEKRREKKEEEEEEEEEEKEEEKEEEIDDDFLLRYKQSVQTYCTCLQPSESCGQSATPRIIIMYRYYTKPTTSGVGYVNLCHMQHTPSCSAQVS